MISGIACAKCEYYMWRFLTATVDQSRRVSFTSSILSIVEPPYKEYSANVRVYMYKEVWKSLVWYKLCQKHPIKVHVLADRSVYFWQYCGCHHVHTPVGAILHTWCMMCIPLGSDPKHTCHAQTRIQLDQDSRMISVEVVELQLHWNLGIKAVGFQ